METYSMDMSLIGAVLLAAQRAEAQDRLSKLSGHYQAPKRSRIGTTTGKAFAKRVARERARKGYR